MSRNSYFPQLAEHIGEQVRLRRKAAKLSQEALGTASYVSGSTVTRYESGDHCPSVEALLMLALRLKCEPADLLPKRDEIAKLFGVKS